MKRRRSAINYLSKPYKNETNKLSTLRSVPFLIGAISRICVYTRDLLINLLHVVVDGLRNRPETERSAREEEELRDEPQHRVVNLARGRHYEPSDTEARCRE